MVPFWGRCTTHFSLFQWGLGCSLGVRDFDSWPFVKLCCILLGFYDFNFLPTNGFSIKPLKVKLFAGEQKAPEERYDFCICVWSHSHLGKRFLISEKSL